MEYKSIKPSELLVGDVITAQFTYRTLKDMPSLLFTNEVVTAVSPTVVIADDLRFETELNVFYLIERPKKPLPTKIGDVVEVDGVEYVRVTEDNDVCPEWAYDDEGYIAESSSERLADLDYTVV